MNGKRRPSAALDNNPFLEYKWYNSHSVPLDVQVGISRLELPLDMKVTDTDLVPENIMCKAVLYSNHQSMTGNIELGTFYATLDEFRNALIWDYAMTFPLKVSNLSSNSIITITAYTPSVGDSKMDALNSTPGDTLYDTMYSKQDFQFIMEKKLESYKVMMMRSQSTLLYTSNNTSIDKIVYDETKNDNGMRKQLHLGTGMSNSLLQDPQTQLGWLDRLVLNQIQLALGDGLTRDRGTTSSHSVKREHTYKVHKDSTASAVSEEDLGVNDNDVTIQSNEGGSKDLSTRVAALPKELMDIDGNETQLLREIAQELDSLTSDMWCPHPREVALDSFCTMIIELPLLSNVVLHEEKQFMKVHPHRPPAKLEDMLTTCVLREDGLREFTVTERRFNGDSMGIVADWDLETENLMEEQYRKLNRGGLREHSDIHTKPNLSDKEQIEKIVNYPSIDKLTGKEKDILYIFRYSLTDNKRALTKFLMSIDWDVPSEVSEVELLLPLWQQKAPIDVAEALKLLGKEPAFQNPLVREYAVDVLENTTEKELSLYLLQLVQALRYEPIQESEPLSLLQAQSLSLVDNFSDDEDEGIEEDQISAKVSSNKLRSNSTRARSMSGMSSPGSTGRPSMDTSIQIRSSEWKQPTSPLSWFLIHRACTSKAIATKLYWFLKVETETDINGLFTRNLEALLASLHRSSNENSYLADQLVALDGYLGNITNCQKDARNNLLKPMFADKYVYIQKTLDQLLKERNLLDIPDNLGSLPNPLDTSISLLGVERCSNVFKSAMVPCVIQVKACNTSDVAMFTTAKIKDRTRSDGAITIPEENPNEMEEDVQKQTEKGVNSSGGETFSTKLFFKQGDDLRTDLLILNMVSLMDNLLKKVNLDLKMRVYGVLATSQKDGIMEFVEHSMPVQAILDNHNGSIRNYLRKYNPDKNDALGIAPEVLDTFIKSCAGSCVMTYILGIGDRHLDNIMITRSGQLFHLDFGFVFGKDPKPLPSPFRLTKEMAMAIGGDNYLQNENFIKFKSLCFQSYNWLRKNGNLIMNLLSLLDDNMIKSGGQPMAIPEVLKVVEERLMLELSDEEAESHFQSLIDTAINALMPKLVELAHILVMKLK